MEELIDETITCKLCGQTFEWSVGEQIFYLSKHLLPPLKCRECRAYQKSLVERREAVSGGQVKVMNARAEIWTNGQDEFRGK